MFFRKNKDKQEMIPLFDEKSALKEALMDNLTMLCEDGVVYEDAFVLEDEEVYIYADIIALKNHVVQVVFQLHHEWMEEAFMEVIVAAGDSDLDAIYNACEQYYDQILSLYLQGLHTVEGLDKVEGFTQKSHYFYVSKSKVNGIGKKEGVIGEDFWQMLKFDLIQRLGNKKVYWIKCFASKQDQKIECEVHINGREAKNLSKKLIPYAMNWDCIGTFHTEKQWILLVQDEETYERSAFAKKDIVAYTKEAIRIFEESEADVSLKQIRHSIYEVCKDTSLTYELLSFIPELYCEYAYPQVEFGEKLFLVQKNRKTKELFQSQLQSFGYIADTVRKHLMLHDVDQETILYVVSRSMNAKAIQNAKDEGIEMQELSVSGIGYLGGEDYILR